MRILLAVIEDLYTFAVSMLFGWREHAPRQQQLFLADALQGRVALAAPEDPVIVLPQSEPADGTLPQKNTIVYAARHNVPLLTSPENGPDTTLHVLAYGDMVMMLDAGPQWSYVAAGDKKGYVETSLLARHAGAVYPEFVIGEENGPRAMNTVRLRSVIRDEFSTSHTHAPLTAHEYVYYKLRRRGLHITWPDVRPRTSGSWARILAPLENVAEHTEPSVGDVMEIAPAEGKAHLAYVEKVFNDGSIQISEADWPERGIYNERVLVAEEWRRLNPTFITVS